MQFRRQLANGKIAELLRKTGERKIEFWRRVNRLSNCKSQKYITLGSCNPIWSGWENSVLFFQEARTVDGLLLSMKSSICFWWPDLSRGSWGVKRHAGKVSKSPHLVHFFYCFLFSFCWTGRALSFGDWSADISLSTLLTSVPFFTPPKKPWVPSSPPFHLIIPFYVSAKKKGIKLAK